MRVRTLPCRSWRRGAGGHARTVPPVNGADRWAAYCTFLALHTWTISVSS